MSAWLSGLVSGIAIGYFYLKFNQADQARKYGILNIAGMKFVRHWEDK